VIGRILMARSCQRGSRGANARRTEASNTSRA
jgi:hypothetical protein